LLWRLLLLLLLSGLLVALLATLSWLLLLLTRILILLAALRFQWKSCVFQTIACPGLALDCLAGVDLCPRAPQPAQCDHGYRRIARSAWIAKLRLRKYLI
jgi:hypothetical protein